MSPLGEQQVPKVCSVLRMRPSGRSQGHCWPVSHESETSMARPSSMLGIQAHSARRGTRLSQASRCVGLEF
jgi:hypothetical protein